MKTKTLRESTDTIDDSTLPSYDLKRMKAVRGKYYKAMQKGYTIRIHKPDGSVTVQHVKPDEPAIWLEPDVREYFPTSEAVNTALRALIMVIEQAPHKEKARTKRRAKHAMA